MGKINQWRWKKSLISKEKTERVIEYIKNGLTIEDIAKSLSISNYQVNRVYSEIIRNKTKFPSLSLLKLRKTEPYYKNEMNYGTYKPTYTIGEVESEYDTNGKPPTMFGACRVIGRQEC